MSKPPESPDLLSRRRFLQGGSALAGGLLVPAWLPLALPRSAAADVVKSARLGDGAGGFGAFVRVGLDGVVTVISPKIEMGQGIQTSIAMMVAEELEVPLSQVLVQEAVPDAALYTDPLLGGQVTGGSTSTRYVWEPLRRAGATARILLTQAAAIRWQVAPSQCHARQGHVYGPGKLQAAYGELVEDAARLPVPEDAPLKRYQDFTLIGSPAQRLDTPNKVNGKALFTIDLVVPDMKIASVMACPVFGGRLVSVDGSKAKAIAGVLDIIELENAVAVTGTTTWACFQGLKALEIIWDYGKSAGVNSEAMEAALMTASTGEGVIVVDTGDAVQSLKTAANRLDAVYQQPFLSRSPLEPMTCVAHVQSDRCTLWVGTQVPGAAQQTAAKVTGLPLASIQVHNQLIGGAFGRRLDFDFITQAVEIAKQVSYPIKLIWSREEDMTHDLYRPHYVDRMSAALDAQNRLLGWQHKITGASIIARYLGGLPATGIDADAVEVASDPIYSLSNLKLHYIREDPKVFPVSWWRGVGALRGTFPVECFIDELAHHAKTDPVQYRLALIQNPRAREVLRVLAEKSDWGSALPAGEGRGVAVSSVFGSFVATLVQLRVSSGTELQITRLVSVIDCGLVTNPRSVKAQIEGGTLFGLSASLFNEITVEDGRVQQNNFHQYRQLRMSDAPPVEVHLISSNESPGGVGEAGTALIAPALVNALHAASGQRIRQLPLKRFGFYTTNRALS